ncbi:MAG: LysE family translocator [Oceanicoccus sp.]|uniref:LysE family translocator n=1 Tax=Oceanicoccus sp. TaxID=2691044 RepID=UPI0026090305|nr:LysE family translocator [Oceanicoccus sp.]MCP3907139.1 LysE family translocator [Oceanicoccus sp.]
MISFETALQFFIVNSSLCLIPCAEMIIVITQSSTQGWKAGMTFVAGTCLALTVQVMLMAFGVSAIIQTSEWIFNGLKIVGVCYLFFLAWQMFSRPIALTTQGVQPFKSRATLFREGMVLNFSTPMTPLFLLFLIPSFIDTERGNIMLQSFQLGGVIILAILSMYTAYCIAADRAGALILQSERFRGYLQRGAASTIAGFAIYLALAQQSL